MRIGQEIIERLRELNETIEAGIPLNERYKVRDVKRPENDEPTDACGTRKGS